MQKDHQPPLQNLDEAVALRIILEGTATETGEKFFAALVERLAEALNTQGAWVNEYLEETRRLRTLAVWLEGRFLNNYEYDILGTPCERVIDEVRLVHFRENVSELFPDNPELEKLGAVSYMGVPLLDVDGRILGNLAVLDTRPMPKEPRGLALFRIFAARATAELQRLSAEFAVRKSEEKYRRIVETAGEGFLLMDKSLNITDVNEAYCKLVGYTRDELIGKTPFELATKEFRQFLELKKEGILSKRYGEFDGKVVAKDGRHIPILVHSNTLTDDQGKVIGNMALVTDMTEHKKSLELAGEVQRSLLPQGYLRVNGLDIAGRSIPCEEIGGDYFDYLFGKQYPDRPFSVVVGDIAGHGVDAALLMTSARAFLRMRSSQPGSISRIVNEMNRHLTMDVLDTGRFMTFLYMTIDTENGRLRWVRAGHDPAMIYNPVHDKFEELKGGGLPLGLDKDFAYEENFKAGLTSGEIIAIGTDGIWETLNSGGEMYGKERFRNIIRKNANAEANSILNAVYSDLDIFRSGLKAEDDITLVIIKIDSSK
jgi:PAS domain S-box-containing protein